MLLKILSLFASVAVLAGCTSNTPEIRAICLRDDIGNYLIKWETYPVIEGTLKMYVSDSPEAFDTSTPAVYANIGDGVTTYVTNDNIKRKYFLLSFNDKYYETVGGRSIVMDSIQNLRDLGGYFTSHNNQMTKWGKIYRSGQLSSMNEWDSIRMENLGIKTILDLRTNNEGAYSPIRYHKANIIHIPIATGNMVDIPERIREGHMRKGDGILYMQDMYLQFLAENNKQFAEVLNQLLNKDNYPILISCSLGKDRVGFLSAMLLASLDVPEETIMKDYVVSNDYINKKEYADMARSLDSDAQETITVLLSANESLMDLVFQQINKEYGSVDKYLSKGLQLTEKKRNQLKDILLY